MLLTQIQRARTSVNDYVTLMAARLTVVCALIDCLPLLLVLAVTICFMMSVQVVGFIGVTSALALITHPPETDHVTFAPAAGLINPARSAREPRFKCLVDAFADFPAIDTCVTGEPHF